MWFNVLVPLFALTFGRAVRPRSARRKAGWRLVRPVLEGLESRWCPSTYNAVNDFFVPAGNPNGPWSYGSLSSFTDGTLTLNTCPERSLLFPGEQGWWNCEFPPNGVTIAKNTTDSTVYYETIVQPPDLLEVDGESKIADVRWVAPAAGVYDITGRFQRIDTANVPVDVRILKNGTTLFDAPHFTIFNDQRPFPASLTRIALSAGDVLDFAEAPEQSSSNDSTGLAVNITTIPESFNCFNGTLTGSATINVTGAAAPLEQWAGASQPPLHTVPASLAPLSAERHPAAPPAPVAVDRVLASLQLDDSAALAFSGLTHDGRNETPTWLPDRWSLDDLLAV